MNYLAGDIGGTKTLLGIFGWEGEIIKHYQKRYLSSDWNSLEPMLVDFLRNLPNDIKQPTTGCLALAGPVTNGKCKLTNLNWELCQQAICKSIGFDSIELINDICVLIYGIPYLNKDQFIQIQTPKKTNLNNGIISIIASGTGLGIAKGYFDGKNFKALPSEGGHKDFSAHSATEWDIYQWLKSDLKLERLSLERIISGNGLGHIARWRLNQSDASSHPLRKIAEIWVNDKKVDLPALVSQSASNGDRIMKEALNIWLSLYGSAAGDLALHELCQGGLWIGGGTAPKQLAGIRSATFLEPMKSKGRFYKYLENIPVMALIDPEVGLFSAACRARMLAE